MALTPETIFAAADALLAQGQEPTLAAVRAAVGGGSFTTISEAMKPWRARREAARRPAVVPPPAALQDAGAALIAELWPQAQAAAEARLEQKRAALAEARAALEAEARQAVAVADQMTAEREQARAERDEAAGRADRLQAERDQLQRERDDARQQSERLQAHGEELTRDLAAARQDAKDNLSRAANLEGLLQAERERRQQAEQAHADRLAAVLERLEVSAGAVKKPRR